MADNPYLSLQRFDGDGVKTDWTVSFAGNRPDAESGTTPYLSVSDVIAYEIIPATVNTAAQRIPRTVQVLGPSQFRVSPAVAAGRKLVIQRNTEDRFNLVDFQALQAVSEYDLDLANRQLLLLTQEAVDQSRLAEDAAVSSETVAYSAINIALGAEDQSIEATSLANFAIATANAARNTANTATDNAHAAITASNEAVSKGNIAVNTANIAHDQAGLAQSKADAATAAANLATTTANLAQNRAETAISTSSTALSRSDTALNLSNTAFDLAEAAEEAGSTALLTVNQANDNASEALSTANAIAGTANNALSIAQNAEQVANDAMDLVQGSGVLTFNGRSGTISSEAGDYTAGMITFGSGTVESAFADLATLVNSKETAMTGYVNSQIATRLPLGAQAADAAKLGGEFPAFYVSQSQLTAAINTRLPSGGKANTAGTADQANKLTKARTINGVNFDGTANIIVQDGTKLPLAGGTVTGVTTFSNASGASNTTSGAVRITGGLGVGDNIYSGGQIVASSNITAYSDARLKDNIDFIPDALHKLGRLGGYTYDRVDITCPRSAGVLAQQVRNVLPEAVREQEDGLLAVDYNGVIALLVEAVNELAAKVKELEHGSTE